MPRSPTRLTQRPALSFRHGAGDGWRQVVCEAADCHSEVAGVLSSEVPARTTGPNCCTNFILHFTEAIAAAMNGRGATHWRLKHHAEIPSDHGIVAGGARNTRPRGAR